jgi:hypothetical protein
MENQFFNSSTHRLVEYKGRAVAIPMMVYWKLSELAPNDTVIIEHTTFGNKAGIQMPADETSLKYHRVKVSELSELEG